MAELAPMHADQTQSLLSDTNDRALIAYQAGLKTYIERCLKRSAIRQFVSPSDIMQLTLVRAVENLDKFKAIPDEQQLPWLRTVAVRLLIDEYRKWKTQRQPTARAAANLQAVNDVVDSTSSIWHKAFRSELKQHLKIVMDEIAPRDQKIVYLRNFQKLEWGQIGEQIGCSADAARVRYRDSILPELAIRLEFLKNCE